METKVISNTTGEVFFVKDSDIEWEQTGAEERAMGAELFYTGTAEFTASDGTTITYTVEASEYPIGSPQEVYETSVAGGEIA